MKVYVDELPEKCSKCKFCTSDYYCTLIHKDVFDYDKTINNQTRYSKCPLKTITEHDKQVRKQVCDEIRQKSTIEYYEEYDGFDRKIGKTYIIRDYELDQIQGENND